MRTRGWGCGMERGKKGSDTETGREGSCLSPGAALEQEPHTEWVPLTPRQRPEEHLLCWSVTDHWPLPPPPLHPPPLG